ncbi:MAG: AmmeMemoRadiSam system radical SAM enzyme [Desulfobacteraceae bacterium]
MMRGLFFGRSLKKGIDMEKVSRRDFLLLGRAALLAAAVPCCSFSALASQTDLQDTETVLSASSRKIFKNDAPDKLWKWSRKGAVYKKLDNSKVICGVCPNRCVLSPGDRSFCRSKVNMDGELYTLAYGNPCAVNIDPVEKKPLFHFKPGIKTLSIAAAGCNFRCLNCQNWQISQARPEDLNNYDLFPAKVVKKAEDHDIPAIAYTYSEAITYYEYMMDTAALAKENNISNLWISNGYINEKPLLELCKVIDAANVNLKAFSDSIYRTLNGGRLAPVLNTFKTLHQQNVHFEMTNLVIPGYTDDPDMVKRMCTWIVKHLGQDHPLHFLRFFPQYKLDRLPPAPVSTLTAFRRIAMDTGIRYVYMGNVPGHEGSHTWCHNCGKLLVKREGYHLPVYNIEKGHCRFCGTEIPGVWT